MIMKIQHQPNAAMKLAAALAVLLAASPAFSETGNCFRYVTEDERASGLPIVIQVESCHSPLGRNVCLRRVGRDIPPHRFDQSYVYVDRCTKNDKFDEEEKP
jgi:hypothetical protein